MPPTLPMRVGANDAHDLLSPLAKPQLGCGEQPVDHIIAAADPVVDELGPAAFPEHEQRRSLALGKAGRELDEDLAAVVERAQRPPGRIVALNRIAEVE